MRSSLRTQVRPRARTLSADESPLPGPEAPRPAGHLQLLVPRHCVADDFAGVGVERRIPASRLATRLELLRNTLRPTPHVQLAMKGMDLFAKLEYVNPVGSIKDRAAYWILTRAAERGEICEETTVIESSSGNFAAALAAFTHLVGLRFIPVIDPNISGAYESFLRRICPTVVKVEDRDDTGGFLKTRLQKVKELCATIPNAYWTNQYGNLDAMEAHYELTAAEICADFDSLDYVFMGVSTAGNPGGVSRRVQEHDPHNLVIAARAPRPPILSAAPPARHISTPCSIPLGRPGCNRGSHAL